MIESLAEKSLSFPIVCDINHALSNLYNVQYSNESSATMIILDQSLQLRLRRELHVGTVEGIVKSILRTVEEAQDESEDEYLEEPDM